MAYGPWGNEASATSTFAGAWITNPDDHEGSLIILKYGGVGRTHSKDRAKTSMQFVGRTYPVYEVGEARAESISVSSTLPGEDEGTAVTIRRLRDIVGDSQIILFRDGRGRKMFAMPTDFQVTDSEQGSYEVSFLLNRVDFDEALPELVDVPVEEENFQVQNFTVTPDIASSTVLIDWDDVADASIYTVYLDGVPVIQTETSMGSYGPLVPGTYSMWATATVAGVEGPASTTQGFVIEEQDPGGGDPGEGGGGTDPGTPPAPSNIPTLTAFPQSNKSVNFTVTPVANATGYKLYEIRSPNGVTNGTYTATSFTRGSPTPLGDGPFDYWVTALGPWGESAISNHQQFTLPYDGSPIGGGGGGEGGTVGVDSIYRTVFEEMAYELTSTAENSRKDWYHTDVYGYIQDIGDERGYTAGIVGFTTATGDMLAMIQLYQTIKPTSNAMATYIDELTTLANAGMGPTAGSQANSLLGVTFRNLWANLAVNDPLFRQAQREYRETYYWRPAFNQAVADNVGPLGLAILYDISVNHGPGSDSESFGGIVTTARAAANPPSLGGTESAYIQALINARSAVLTSWGDNPSDGRVAMHNALKTAGKYLLQIPPTLSWSVYGDSFSMTSRPELPAEAARPGNVQPGTPGTGGTGGGGALPTPVVALGLGTADGQLHYNLGMGFRSGHVNITPTELYAWNTTTGNIKKLVDEGWVFTKLDTGNNIVVSLEAPRDGGTTSSNTQYARCEFREQDEDGDGNISFNPNSGMHYQEGFSRITQITPLKPGVCFNQMHDADGDTFMLKTKKSGTKIVVVCDVMGEEAAVIDTDYKVGELIWSRLEVNNGTMKAFYIKGGSKTTTAALTVTPGGLSSSGWYNKFGNYLQSNETTDSTGRIVVEVRGWKHWHTGWPTPLDSSGGVPVVSAGADATVSPGGTFTRTGVATGAGITARGWRLVGAGTAGDPGTAAFANNWGSPDALSDEFNYTGTPDPAKWGLYDGPGHAGNGLRVPARCTVSGGTLKINGLAGAANTGGMAHTQKRQYGKWEVRMRTRYTSAPTNQGTLTPVYSPVCLIWSDTDPWPRRGEYDFVEPGRPGEPNVGAFLHYPSLNGSDSQVVVADYPVDMREFHNYAIEWNSSGIKLYVDGVLWANHSGGSNANRENLQNMDADAHLCLQLDAFAATGQNAAFMEFEWARSYPLVPVGTNPGLATTDTLNWTAPTTPGTYTLEYFATNSSGTSTDQVVVTVTGTPVSTLVYPETFDDGTPYSAFGPGQTVVNVSGSAALTTALANASPGQIITLAAGTYTGDFAINNKAGTSSNGIVLRSSTSLGAVFSSGSSLTINNCTNLTVEGIDFPYDQEGDTIMVRGNSANVRLTRCRIGPASLTNSALTGNYVFVGDDVRHFRIDHNTLRNKGTNGNAVRVYGNGTTQVVCKYGRLDHNLIDTIGNEVGNDKEAVRWGVSAMSRSDTFSVIERNVIVNSKGDPEVISGKAGRLVQRGNVLLRCTGSMTLRHGRNSKQQSNYFVDRANTTGTLGTKSGGSRFYDSGHLIEDNYYDGLASTSGYERPIILDTGDVGGTSTNLAGHWNVVDATVQRNVIISCTGGIYVGDNYATPPDSCGILNNDIVASGITAVTTVDLPMTGDSVVSGNTVYASAAAGGYTADGAGIYRKSGRGPKVSYLAASDVGTTGDLSDLDKTGAAV